MKALQDRLAATNLKMSDLRNQVQSLKQELRLAQKVFQSQASGLGWSWDQEGAGQGQWVPFRIVRAWPREHHAACSGSGASSSNFLPPALKTDPFGAWGCRLPEGVGMHALWCLLSPGESP